MEQGYLAFMIIFLILGIGLGWFINEFYESYKYQKQFEGLFMQEKNWTSAWSTAKEYDQYGEWICVNVRGMNYQRAVEVCQHEAAHEIFAEIIEKYPERIDDVMGAINQTKKN